MWNPSRILAGQMDVKATIRPLALSPSSRAAAHGYAQCEIQRLNSRLGGRSMYGYFNRILH